MSAGSVRARHHQRPSMEVTPVSLLETLRRPDPGPAWDRFVHLYTDLLYTWARRLGAVGPDADDLVQDVFAVLVRELPGFQYAAGGRFRGWLWTVARNKARERARRPAVPVGVGGLSDVAGPAADDPAEAVDDLEYRNHITRKALELMRADFEPETWRAFWEVVAEGRPAADVAADLGLTANAVYLAKGRVLRRLRAELAGLLD